MKYAKNYRVIVAGCDCGHVFSNELVANAYKSHYNVKTVSVVSTHKNPKVDLTWNEIKKLISKNCN